MRWLMTLGEHTRPHAADFAACPGPHEARAVALVDDAADLFPVLLEWRRAYGTELTAYANRVEASDLEDLPSDVVEQWGPDELRLDTLPGGYIKVSDYRDQHAGSALAPNPNVLVRHPLPVAVRPEAARPPERRAVEALEG
ncbi:hypothetical protein [Streptomyces sp. NPDC094468]|uniref:hypothetical protein n=1 Tax=Streptomyces sp. NPDC094468 TaxID=3366066 RepID=UPI0038283158